MEYINTNNPRRTHAQHLRHKTTGSLRAAAQGANVAVERLHHVLQHHWAFSLIAALVLSIITVNAAQADFNSISIVDVGPVWVYDEATVEVTVHFDRDFDSGSSWTYTSYTWDGAVNDYSGCSSLPTPSISGQGGDDSITIIIPPQRNPAITIYA